MRTRQLLIFLLALSSLAGANLLHATEAKNTPGESIGVTTGADPETGLRFWEWDRDGFYLRLTQRLPDQTRGFFEARGFDQQTLELIATSCVFQSMIKNSSNNQDKRLTANLADWKIHSGNDTHRLLLREHWQQVWNERNTPQASRIAFNWSFLPSTVSYDANDYNWGMTSYGLRPGSHFDLVFSWKVNGKLHHGRINDIACPDDIHPEPTAN